MEAVQFIAWSDYLCPWCWNASRTLWRLVDEYDGRLRIEWRAYLLRPAEKKNRDREKIRKYTENWRVIGAEPGAGEFNVWSSDDAPGRRGPVLCLDEDFGSASPCACQGSFSAAARVFRVHNKIDASVM